MSNLVNPSAGNVYFDVAGSAITSQPTTNTGTAAGLGYYDGENLGTVDIAKADADIYGSTVYRGSGNGVSSTLPKTGGDFAKMTPGHYVMRCGGANTEYLAGVADTNLRSGASDFGIRKNPKNRGVIRGSLIATAIRNNQWVAISGVWSTDPTASTAGLGDVAGLTESGVDQSVTPTGLIAGELVYSLGGVPVYADYQPRTTR
jgi:hypothetical protein